MNYALKICAELRAFIKKVYALNKDQRLKSMM